MPSPNEIENRFVIHYEPIYAHALTRKISDQEITDSETFWKFHNEFIETLPEGRMLNFKQIDHVLKVREHVIILSQQFSTGGRKNRLRNRDIEITILAQFYIKEFFDK